MSFIETMMKAMTHLNIGAAIAMLAWILWSGLAILSGDIPAARHTVAQASQQQLAPAGQAPSRAEVKP